MLKAGERLWNGAIVTADLAAAYNSAQERIQSFRAAGLPVPDQILNGVHSLLNFDAATPRHLKRQGGMK